MEILDLRVGGEGFDRRTLLCLEARQLVLRSIHIYEMCLKKCVGHIDENVQECPPAHLEVWVRRRRPVSLHVDKPGWRCTGRHAQRLLKGLTHDAGLGVLDLKEATRVRGNAVMESGVKS